MLGTLVLGAVINSWHAFQTKGYRNKAQVPYPETYAPASEAAKDPAKYQFNCAQRAHANYTENLPAFALATIVAGLRFPVIAAAVGTAWLVGRVGYARGYTKTSIDKEKNIAFTRRGAWFQPAQMGLLGLAIWTVVGMVL